MLEAGWSKNERSSIKSKLSNQTKKKKSKEAGNACKHWVWKDVAQPTTRLNQICRRIEELKEKNLECIHTLSKYDPLEQSSPTFAMRNSHFSSSPGKIGSLKLENPYKMPQFAPFESVSSPFGYDLMSQGPSKPRKLATTTKRVDGTTLMRKKPHDWVDRMQDKLRPRELESTQAESVWKKPKQSGSGISAGAAHPMEFHKVNSQLKRLLHPGLKTPSFSDIASRARHLGATMTDEGSSVEETSWSKVTEAKGAYPERPRSQSNQRPTVAGRHQQLTRSYHKQSSQKPDVGSKSFDLSHLKHNLKSMDPKELIKLRDYIQKRLDGTVVAGRTKQTHDRQDCEDYSRPSRYSYSKEGDAPLTFSRHVKDRVGSKVPPLAGWEMAIGDPSPRQEAEFSGLDFKLVKTDKLFGKIDHANNETAEDPYKTMTPWDLGSSLLAHTPLTQTKHRANTPSASVSATGGSSYSRSSESREYQKKEDRRTHDREYIRSGADALFPERHRPKPSKTSKRPPQNVRLGLSHKQHHSRVTTQLERDAEERERFQGLMQLDSSVCESVLGLGEERGSGEGSRSKHRNNTSISRSSAHKEDYIRVDAASDTLTKQNLGAKLSTKGQKMGSFPAKPHPKPANPVHRGFETWKHTTSQHRHAPTHLLGLGEQLPYGDLRKHNRLASESSASLDPSLASIRTSQSELDIIRYVADRFPGDYA